jgi:hypothetical protein
MQLFFLILQISLQGHRRPFSSVAITFNYVAWSEFSSLFAHLSHKTKDQTGARDAQRSAIF